MMLLKSEVISAASFPGPYFIYEAVNSVKSYSFRFCSGRKRSALYCRPSWLKATKKILPIINTKTKSKCTGAKITSPVCSGSVDKEYAASFSRLEKVCNGESGDNHDGIARDASTASCSSKQPFSSIEKFSLNHKAAIEDNNGREEGKKTFLQSSSKLKTNFKDTNTDVQILDEVSKVDTGTSNLDSFFHPFADDDADMSRSQAEEYCKDSILEGEESEEQNCSSEEDYVSLFSFLVTTHRSQLVTKG